MFEKLFFLDEYFILPPEKNSFLLIWMILIKNSKEYTLFENDVLKIGSVHFKILYVKMLYF